MPITFLRFRPGASGDTILKCILDSHKNINSQMQYVGNVDGKTEIDEEHLKQFRYNQISNLSFQYFKTDPQLLQDQLLLLANENPTKEWLLKSHYYGELNYPVIDIIVGKKMLPFIIKAILNKRNSHPNYVPMISQIKDKKILYQYNCYNYAVDSINTEKNMTISNQSLRLEQIVSGWKSFKDALQLVNLSVSQDCKNYYDSWLTNNHLNMPSDIYLQLINQERFDYRCPGLSIEEKYCLLALAGEKFKILEN